MTAPISGDVAEQIADLAERVHIHQALHAAALRWEDVSAAAFEAESDEDFREAVVNLLDVSDKQARAIAEMQVSRVTRLSRSRIKDQLQDLRAELAQVRRDNHHAEERSRLD